DRSCPRWLEGVQERAEFRRTPWGEGRPRHEKRVSCSQTSPNCGRHLRRWKIGHTPCPLLGCECVIDSCFPLESPMCFPNFSTENLPHTQMTSTQFSGKCQEMPDLAPVGTANAR